MTDKSPRSISAAKRNGLIGQVNRYLNTIGSWSTYRDLDNVEAIPSRLAQVTTAYLGLKGLAEGHPRLAGLLGVVIAVHALEQVTGGLATAGMRLYARGRPLATYRGVLIRPSPFTPRMAHLLNRLLGGRVLDARGYYFFEAGQTWHCQSLTFQLGDQPRTLTLVQSFSLPQREFLFDRPVHLPGEREPAAVEKTIAIQRVVDVVKGEDPDTVPGFLGSINELEGLTPLRGLKQALCLANWLLVDPSERDGGEGGDADYEALVKGTPPGGGNAGSRGVYLVPPPTGGPPTGGGWPSTTRLPLRPSHSSSQSGWPASVPSSPPPPPPPPHESELFIPGSAVPSHPATRYKDRLRIGPKEYPLVIKRVVRSPFNGDERKADAVYYDDEVGRWREVVNEEDRLNLARAVAEGRLTLVDPAHWPT